MNQMNDLCFRLPNRWQINEDGIRRRHCGDGGADEADGGEVAGACDKAAERRAAADADVEEAGVDGRRDGRARAARRAQELGLHRDVEERRNHAEHEADGDEGGRECGGGGIEQRASRHADAAREQAELPVRAICMRKDDAAQKAEDAERDERCRDGFGREARDGAEIRLDVAVDGEIARRERDGEDEVAEDEWIFHERGQVAGRKWRAALREAREDASEVEECADRHARDAEERHAPAEREADDAPDGQAENHRDGRARRDAAQRERLMFPRHEPGRERRRDGPENRMGAGDGHAGGHEHGKARREPRANLPGREEREHREQQPFRLHAAGGEHQRQRHQADDPGVRRNHDARFSRRFAKGIGDVREQRNRHELRRVEHEGRHREPDEWQEIFRRDGGQHGELLSDGLRVIRADGLKTFSYIV